MAFRYDTYCGLYCGACDILLANKRNLLEETAKSWNMKPNDLMCHGCKTDTTSTYCKTCDIKKCADSRNIEFCFQCDEYPCSYLLEFKSDECPHHSVILKNLNFLRDYGLAKWLETQQKRWKCPECGREFSWYEETCTNCGGNLYGCKEEEKELDEL